MCPLFEPLTLLGRQLQVNLFGDVARDFTLQQQNVTQFPVVSLCPEVLVGGRIHQLGRDANVASGKLEGALHHCINVQLSRDLRQRFVRALVLHHRSVGNHFQVTELGKLGGQIFCHSLRDEVLRRIGCQIRKREDRQGPERSDWSAEESIPQAADIESNQERRNRASNHETNQRTRPPLACNGRIFFLIPLCHDRNRRDFGSRYCRRTLNLADETVTAAGKSLDKAGVIRRVA